MYLIFDFWFLNFMILGKVIRVFIVNFGDKFFFKGSLGVLKEIIYGNFDI